MNTHIDGRFTKVDIKDIKEEGILNIKEALWVV